MAWQRRAPGFLVIEEKGRHCLFAGASYHAAIIGEKRTYTCWLLLLPTLAGVDVIPHRSHMSITCMQGSRDIDEERMLH